MADILQFVQDEGKAQRHLKEYLEKSIRAVAVEKDRVRKGTDGIRTTRTRGPTPVHRLYEREIQPEHIETLMIADTPHAAENHGSFVYPDSETTSRTSYHKAQAYTVAVNEQAMSINSSRPSHAVRYARGPPVTIPSRWDRRGLQPIVSNRHRLDGDICFLFYARGHWARNCTMDITSDYLSVVANYGKLSQDDRKTVSKKSFFRAVQLLQASVKSLATQAEVASRHVKVPKDNKSSPLTSLIPKNSF